MILYLSRFNEGNRNSKRYIFRDLLQEIGLCDCRFCLGKCEICEQVIRKDNLDLKGMSWSCSPQKTNKTKKKLVYNV